VALVGATIVSVATLGVTAALAQPVPGGTLDPTIIPKYVQPLVIPPVMSSAGPNDYDIAVREFQQQILPGGHWNAVSPACIADATLCTLPATTVWSYGPAADPLPDSSGLAGGAVGLAPALNSQFNYPAFTVENEVDVPTTVDWINDLKDPATGRFLPHLLPIDQTLHWANPNADCIAGAPRTDCRGDSGQPYNGPVPIIVHVHGAHVDPESDGYPEAWYLPDPTGSNFSCVTDPAQAKGTKYVCQGSLANGYGATPNTNVTPGVGNFAYRNDQPSTTLWYHDHTLGMTRSNVYAGPAGFWLIREPGGGETGLVTGTLPGPAPKADDDPNFDPLTRGMIREIPVVIQDRSFNEDGSLFYPESRAFFEGVPDNQLNIRTLPNPRSDISPIWNPEAFFNTIVVNGTTWPLLEVEPERYRLRLLNGCNSRFLNVALKTVNPDGTLGSDVPMYQIGAEQSLLPQVVKVETGLKTVLQADGTEPPDGTGTPAADPQEALLMGLAERADVIVDFSGISPGTTIRMINTGPDAPFGGFPDVPADPSTTGQVMQFAVVADNPDTVDSSTPPASLELTLVDPDDPAADPAPNGVVRDLALLEEESAQVCARFLPTGAILQIGQVMAGPTFLADCAAAGGFPFAPKAAVLGDQGSLGGAVTLWSDPIVTNPALGATETWELWNWSADAHPIHLHLVKFKVTDRQLIDGPVRPPEATEAGWKDTVIAYPGEVTRVKATFDIPGLYVWHCHIVEHEDNEMMVPYCVGDPSLNGCAGL
jgi:FtsP/CotA-like multicopper oxidase with cupredoxin domain